MGNARRKIGSRDQVDAVLASDLDEGARVLWVYLAVCAPGGLGRARLTERLSLIDFDAATEILIEAKLLKKVVGKLIPLPFLIPTDEDPPDAEPTPLREAALEILALYNAARADAGIDIPAAKSEKTMAKLEDLAEWLADSNVDPAAFLRFGIERAKFLKEREHGAVAFLPLHLFTGPWLREEWASVPSRKRTTGHAGKSYDQEAGLRALLLAAGFESAERASEAELRHVKNWAESMIADPVGYPEADPEWDGEIRWVVRRLKSKGKL